MRKIYPLAILVLVALIFQVSASVVCSSTNPISQSYLEGSILIDEFTIATSCLNNGDTQVTSTVASNNNFFSLLEHPIIINSNSTKGSLKIKFNQATTQGLYNGFVVIGDLTIPISLNVTKTQTNPNEISFPTSKTININQGETLNNKVTLILPSNYPQPINIVAIEFTEESGLISFGDVETGIVNPGSSKDIPLIINAKSAGIGQYPPITLKVRYDDGAIHELTSKITIIVKSNINPQTVETFSTRPNCALSSSNMNKNGTYTFSCTGIVENLQVNPQYSEYFEGISVDTTANIFTYTLRPIKIGNFLFRAIFTYKGSPIFSPFESEVRIGATSGSVGGTNLRLIFTPELSLAKNGQVISVQLVDNLSSSLVENPSIEINAIPVTNRSDRTFFYAFEINKNYTIRGVSPSYIDLVEIVSLSSKPINLIISPESGSSNTLFNITTDANATIFVNGESKGNNYFGILPSGNLEIKAFKEGYIDAIKNITISSLVSFTTNPEFKKGEVKIISLDKNSTWNLYYQKSPTDLKELLITGTGNQVEFTPTEKGDYILETTDGSSSIYSIQGTNWNKKWWFMAWYWWFIGGGLLMGFFYIYKKNTGENSMSGDVNYA